MKNKRIILLFTAFLTLAQLAFGQTHGNFSDWNVPAPQAPGTIQKGAAGSKPATIPRFIDVPPVNVPQTGPVQLNKMPPVLVIAPEVNIPGQPTIPGLSAGSFGTPLPAAPDAPAMPAEVPHDAVFKMTADITAPLAPPMPESPKLVPIGTPGDNSQGGVHLPVTPLIESQPFQAKISNGQFSFSEWALPGLPGNTQIVCPLPDIAPPKALPKAKQSGKKTHKTGNSN